MTTETQASLEPPLTEGVVRPGDRLLAFRRSLLRFPLDMGGLAYAVLTIFMTWPIAADLLTWSRAAAMPGKISGVCGGSNGKSTGTPHGPVSCRIALCPDGVNSDTFTRSF